MRITRGDDMDYFQISLLSSGLIPLVIAVCGILNLQGQDFSKINTIPATKGTVVR